MSMDLVMRMDEIMIRIPANKKLVLYPNLFAIKIPILGPSAVAIMWVMP